mmetsp:Transcript_101774/g.287038  ORF Transcript_101774/g.287038 Transcript_101774/m.287038 type:complete len:366 (-) Transcript_101774:32-1129(-)
MLGFESSHRDTATIRQRRRVRRLGLSAWPRVAFPGGERLQRRLLRARRRTARPLGREPHREGLRLHDVLRRGRVILFPRHVDLDGFSHRHRPHGGHRWADALPWLARLAGRPWVPWTISGDVAVLRCHGQRLLRCVCSLGSDAARRLARIRVGLVGLPLRLHRRGLRSHFVRSLPRRGCLLGALRQGPFHLRAFHPARCQLHRAQLHPRPLLGLEGVLTVARALAPLLVGYSEPLWSRLGSSHEARDSDGECRRGDCPREGEAPTSLVADDPRHVAEPVQHVGLLAGTRASPRAHVAQEEFADRVHDRSRGRPPHVMRPRRALILFRSLPRACLLLSCSGFASTVPPRLWKEAARGGGNVSIEVS